MVKFSFFSLFCFSFSFALKTYGTLKIFLLSFQDYFYIEFICRGAGGKKIKSEFHVSGWFPGFQNLIFFFIYRLFYILSCHYGFPNYFEILHFLFLITYIPRIVSTCKILSFQDQHFKKYKPQKIINQILLSKLMTR